MLQSYKIILMESIFNESYIQLQVVMLKTRNLLSDKNTYMINKKFVHCKYNMFMQALSFISLQIRLMEHLNQNSFYCISDS